MCQKKENELFDYPFRTVFSFTKDKSMTLEEMNRHSEITDNMVTFLGRLRDKMNNNCSSCGKPFTELSVVWIKTKIGGDDDECYYCEDCAGSFEQKRGKG